MTTGDHVTGFFRYVGLWMLVACVLFPARAAMALGPHEIVLIVNEASPDSVDVARRYAELRGIPDLNVIRVKVPPVKGVVPFEITLDEFAGLIRTPVARTIRERGLDEQVLAWVYSIDFPIRISGKLPLSLMGATFGRGKDPDRISVTNGTYRSLFFAGPDNADSSGRAPQTLDTFSRLGNGAVPVPSMMLGYTGVNGNAVKTVMESLLLGRASDGIHPTGCVYFVSTDDIRSVCRAWQFDVAQRELWGLGQPCQTSRGFPQMESGVVGIMMGAAEVDPTLCRYVPGAIADNLTSFGAAFDQPEQTKVSAWFRGGATAAAGAVTEPLSMWMKFPHARLFVHYRSGCGVLESYYQAIRCPLQILLLGDPLACPWGQKAEFGLKDFKDEFVGRVRLEVEPVHTPVELTQFVWLLDGRVIGKGSRPLTLNSRQYPDGPYTLRVVGYTDGRVRLQSFRDFEIEINNE